MGMTMSQKILAKACGLKEVKAGQLVEATLDMIHTNDIVLPMAIPEFDKIGAKAVNDPNKICVVLDHFTPNKDIKSAQMSKDCREFCATYGIESFYDVGEMGIEHCLIPEKGIVAPGDLEVGSDSHTCTYGALGAFSTGIGTTDLACAMVTGKLWFKVPAAIKFVLKGKPSKNVSGKDLILHIIGKIGVDGARYKSMEYVGEGVKYLSMDDRFTICNMAIEAGGKNGIFPVDEKTREYVAAHPAQARLNKKFEVFEADPDAEYDEVYEIDLSQLEPTVSYPHSPGNAKLAKELGEVEIDQVVLGSCTNGRISDLRIAAEILRGKQVKKGLRVIIIPGSQEVYLQALKEGLIEDFIKAGAAVSTPTCGPCWGGHMGVLAKGEKCVSTTNRNFIGRMGHNESQVYLASPATAAASALTGRITSPECL